jgi:hypothetical protein
VDQQAGPVKVRDLQVGAFLKAQAAGVDGGETHPIAKPLEVCQKGADLCGTEEDRECLFAWGPDEGQGGPCPRQGVFIDKLDAAQGNGTGTARVGLDVFEIETGGPEFFLGDAVGGLVVMRRQWADGPDLHLLGPCGQASEV